MLTLLLGTDWIANRDKVLEMIARDVLKEKPGVVYMVPENCMQAVEGSYFIKKTLEDAGIPVLIFKADPVDARKWNAQSMTELVEDFIENRIINKAGEQK